MQIFDKEIEIDAFQRKIARTVYRMALTNFLLCGKIIG